MNDSPLNAALRHFEAAEANLLKIEKVWAHIRNAIPDGVAFGTNPEYEDNCRYFDELLNALPRIDGWKPEIELMELDEIAQLRLEAIQIGEIEWDVWVDQRINEPGGLLRKYRFRFNQKRRELIRDALTELIDHIDDDLRQLSPELGNPSSIDEFFDNPRHNEVITNSKFDELNNHVSQIDTLLGSSVARPKRWSDLFRHLRFGQLKDLYDIINSDWPDVKSGLQQSLYGEKEPVPIEIDDLSSLVNSKPRGPVTTRLNWGNLSPDEFERLIFTLIASENHYENPEWLMKTNAPDRGRDLSVFRVFTDPLGGTKRQRVIIQCKHWLSKSVAPPDVSGLRDQMKLWEPPRVDVHVIATTGRFTGDAVALIEKHNQSDSALTIEMWPDSHLERLLASRPGIIAEFQLR